MTKALKYTQEMVSFLYRNCDLDTKELTKAFNDKFGTSQSVGAIKGKKQTLRLKTGRTGCFKKGHIPWNKGKKLLSVSEASKATQFKKGSIPANLNPVGHERICSKDGYVLVKIAETNPYTNAPTRYKQKHKVVWERHNGPIPKNHVIRFFDGDKTNCDIGNLFCVSQAVHLRLNQKGFHILPIELRAVVKTLSVLEVDIFAKSKVAYINNSKRQNLSLTSRS